MGNKIKQLSAVYFFILCLPFMYSQQCRYYFIRESKNGAQFFQHFSWESSGNVLRYEFCIEKQNNDGTYTEIDCMETKKNSIEVSLDAGIYRYKIIVYNLLDVPELETIWLPVEIRKAYQPVIRDVFPRLVYLEEEQDGIYTVHGSELREDAVFELTAGTGDLKRTVPGKILEHDAKNKKVKLIFDADKVDVAKYCLVVRNPGGLTSYSNTITVRFQKPVDLDIAAGYSCMFVLQDNTINTYFDTGYCPRSASARLTFIPLKRLFGYLGFSIDGSYFRLLNELDKYNVSTHVFSSHLGLVYQKEFYRKKLFVDLHAGAGVTKFSDMKFKFIHDVVSEPLNSLNFSLNSGAALQFYIKKRLYVEAGFDSSHVFVNDMAFQYLQPVVLCGWQF